MATKAKKDQYEVTVISWGKKYTGVGKTVSDALATIDIRNPKGKAVISVTHGEVKKDRIIMGSQVSRLFTGRGLMREVALKNVSTLFDGV